MINGEPREIRIVQIQKRHLDRMGLESMIHASPLLAQVGSTTNIQHGRELCAHLRPEVAIVSTEFPQDQSFKFAESVIRENRVRGVVLLDDELKLSHIVRALEIKQVSYYTRNARFGELAEGIQAASQCQSRHDIQLIDKLRIDGPENKLKLVVKYPSILDLSARELQVMRLFVSGMAGREVGETLGISENTVVNHKASIMKKLGVNKGSQLVEIAFRDGMPGTLYPAPEK